MKKTIVKEEREKRVLRCLFDVYNSTNERFEYLNLVQLCNDNGVISRVGTIIKKELVEQRRSPLNSRKNEYRWKTIRPNKKMAEKVSFMAGELAKQSTKIYKTSNIVKNCSVKKDIKEIEKEVEEQINKITPIKTKSISIFWGLIKIETNK